MFLLQRIKINLNLFQTYITRRKTIIITTVKAQSNHYQNALGFVFVDVLHLHHPQGDQEGVQRNLMSLDQQAHFLEQVPENKTKVK